MTAIKEKFISLFKYETQLTLGLKITEVTEKSKTRVTIDNYVSKFSISMKIQEQFIKTFETKYYWPDKLPDTGKKCVNFRLRDDSLLVVKLNKSTSFMCKSNKIKIHYFQNYLKLVSENKLKYKGNSMNDLIRKQDKFIYYDAYKNYVSDLEKFYYTYSVQNGLLLKLGLTKAKSDKFSVNVTDIEIENLIEDKKTSV